VKLVTFEGTEGPRLGAILAGEVIDLQKAAQHQAIDNVPTSMQALIERGEQGLDLVRALLNRAAVDDIARSPRLLAPLPRPIRLRDCCMFLEHMEIGLAKVQRAIERSSLEPQSGDPSDRAVDRVSLHPEFYRQVIYYNADHLHIFGPDDDVCWPNQAGWADYELELACVVGKNGRDIDRGTARDFIFGVTIFNDWSARDLQIPFMEARLGPGEGKDFANSLGPCIVTLDEIGDIYDLTMTARVNGTEWSRGSSRSIHHHFEAAIAQFSRGKTLFAGEVIGSGTVASGCGLELDKKLGSGDVVELEVEKIGILRNRVVVSADAAGRGESGGG
jgi:2-keto-4-pentenoate hydratase/2-oxohepta-3-ene-1,7-dioic acid hydratase in catechol pathway